jgi:sterol 3beta-glucosyltransferase
MESSRIENPGVGIDPETLSRLTGGRGDQAPVELDATPREKSRLEWEILASMKGTESKVPTGSRGTAQQSTVEGAELDWDAPPPYDQSFGNERRQVSTAVLGKVPFLLSRTNVLTFLDNGRISMMFRGHGHNFTTLPPLPEYEPQVERMRTFASHSYPILNIVIQVVGSRG